MRAFAVGWHWQNACDHCAARTCRCTSAASPIPGRLSCRGQGEANCVTDRRFPFCFGSFCGDECVVPQNEGEGIFADWRRYAAFANSHMNGSLRRSISNVHHSFRTVFATVTFSPPLLHDLPVSLVLDSPSSPRYLHSLPRFFLHRQHP